MMDVHEADGVVPSDPEEENDDSTSSSSASSDSSTVMLFDKPQPLVLELHELKKTDQSSVEKQNPAEQYKAKKQALANLSEKPKKLKKKRKSSNASKVISNTKRQSKDARETGAMSTPTAIVDTTKEEFFDAQDTVMPVSGNEPVPDTSSPPAAKVLKDFNQPISKDLGQPIAQVTPPWARPVDKGPLLGPEAKVDANQELSTRASIPKEHRSTNAITKPVE